MDLRGLQIPKSYYATESGHQTCNSTIISLQNKFCLKKLLQFQSIEALNPSYGRYYKYFLDINFKLTKNQEKNVFLVYSKVR